MLGKDLGGGVGLVAKVVMMSGIGHVCLDDILPALLPALVDLDTFCFELWGRVGSHLLICLLEPCSVALVLPEATSLGSFLQLGVREIEPLDAFHKGTVSAQAGPGEGRSGPDDIVAEMTIVGVDVAHRPEDCVKGSFDSDVERSQERLDGWLWQRASCEKDGACNFVAVFESLEKLCGEGVLQSIVFASPSNTRGTIGCRAKIEERLAARLVKNVEVHSPSFGRRKTAVLDIGVSNFHEPGHRRRGLSLDDIGKPITRGEIG